MKAMLAILLLLSTGLWAVAQETATNTNGKHETVREVVNPALSGSGKTDYVPLWLNSTTLGDSKIYQTGGKVGIGTTTPKVLLDVNGSINAKVSYTLGGTTFAFGSYAYWNAFLGFAGNATMTGSANTAAGYQALYSNTTGGQNTASGVYALLFNTTGDYNTASGMQSLVANTTGSSNTASGHGSLNYNTEGGANTASGDQALYHNTTGSYNTASGVEALLNNNTGNYNTALGAFAGPDYNSTNLTNATAIGANAVVSQSNALVLGGPLGSGYNVNVGIGTATPSNVFTIAKGAGHAVADGWDTYSSRRWKTNIQPLHGALGKVEQLRGVSYDLKNSGKHEIGVIAEEVGAVVPEVVSWDKNGKDAQGVDYGRLTALLIEATKEQQALIHTQQEQIRAQQAQIAKLMSQVKAIQASLKTNGRTGTEIRTVKAQAHMVSQ